MQTQQSSFLNTIKNIFVRRNIDDKTLEQRKQADSYLQSGFYEEYIHMISVGYIQTPTQQKKFYKYFNNLISNCSYDEGYSHQSDKGKENAKYIVKTVNSLIGAGFHLSPNYLIAILNNYNVWNQYHGVLYKLLTNYEDTYSNVELKNIIPFLRNNLSQPIYTQQIFNNLLKLSKTINKSRNNKMYFCFILMSIPDSIFKYIEFNDFAHLSSLVQPSIKNVAGNDIFEYCNYNSTFGSDSKLNINLEIKNRLNQIKDSNYRNIIENHNKNTKQIYSYHQQLIQREEYNIKQVELELLPGNIKDLLAEANSLEAITAKYVESYAIETKFELDNLFNKRIPEALNTYFEIMPKYRNIKIENQTKTAQVILYETLNNYCKKLNILVKIQQEENISKLNALQRYSQKI